MSPEGSDHALRALLDLPEQGSSYAESLDHLHFAVIGTTMLGATVVFLVALYFVVRYRRRPGDGPTPRVHAPLLVEVLMIGGLLSLFIAFWLLGYRLYVDVVTPPKDAMEVYVTGKQWMWKFAYPNGRSSISVLTVPAGRPIKLFITSRDVIHSFFVPAFRMKFDAVPGRYTTAWFEAHEGSYEAFCAELCGIGHSDMRARVEVVSPERFEAWMEEQPPEAPDDLLARAPAETAQALAPRYEPRGDVSSLAALGETVAARHGCFACHTLDGRRHIGPSFRGLYGKWVELENGERVLADERYLTRSMMDPRADIVAGFDPVMPPFQGLLTAPEVAALLEMIKSVAPGVPDGPFPGREPVPDVAESKLGPRRGG